MTSNITRKLRQKRARWEAIKAITLPEPQILHQPDVQLYYARKGKAGDRAKPSGPINRAYRRQQQGRIAGFAQPRRTAARLTGVDSHGRSTSLGPRQ